MDTQVISSAISSGLSGSMKFGVFVADRFGVVTVTFNLERYMNTAIVSGTNVFVTDLEPFFDVVKEKGSGTFRLGHKDNHECMLYLSKLNEQSGEEGWIAIVHDASDPYENSHSENLVRLLSMRRAHEMLNVMTPVYGTLQMLKQNTDSRNDHRLIELAETELLKGKAHVNDFLKINNLGELTTRGITVSSFIQIVQKKVNVQLPEAVPYMMWRFLEVEEVELDIDAESVCIAVFFLVKKSIDYIKDSGRLELAFEQWDKDVVQLNIRHAYQSLSFSTDEEMRFYTDTAKKVLQKQGGYLSKNHCEIVLHLPVMQKEV
ncbi:hypothetical protein [Alteribacter aurantiacus]|uniref:hypothetical protein n=1 Tax=Alteribacter aurantiacus TaxID=254410 RepID=UPI0003FDF578|nr:hypothetical protein [Alteribacter aurantiacus]